MNAAADAESRTQALAANDFSPFPENPIVKQYNIEYWLLGDLMMPLVPHASSMAERVRATTEADMVFMLFFAGLGKEVFKKKVESNEDYWRQRQAVDFRKNTEAWKQSGGRDHVFWPFGFFSSPNL